MAHFQNARIYSLGAQNVKMMDQNAIHANRGTSVLMESLADLAISGGRLFVELATPTKDAGIVMTGTGLSPVPAGKLTGDNNS